MVIFCMKYTRTHDTHSGHTHTHTHIPLTDSVQQFSWHPCFLGGCRWSNTDTWVWSSFEYDFGGTDIVCNRGQPCVNIRNGTANHCGIYSCTYVTSALCA